MCAVLALTAVILCLLALQQRDRTLLLVAALAGAAAWWQRPERDVDRWRRGAAGEWATDALLAGLSRRWVVRPDCAIPGSRANIDHLVIGPTGVWVIDTKSVRARLRVRHRQVWAGDRCIDTGPVAWEADVVSGLLAVDVVPVVVIQGQAIRRRGVVSGGVRVLPARRLVRRLRRGRRVLSRGDVADLARRAEKLLPPW